MFKNQEKIREELATLIAKGNTYLNESQNKQRVVAYLYIIFSLFALSFFGLFAIGPTITTITNLRKEYDEGKIALKELTDKNNALKELSTQYLSIEPDLLFLDNAIPQTPKVSELTRQIEYLSKSNNLVVQKLDSGLLELYPIINVTSPVFSYNLTVSVSGSEGEVNKFIGEVINMGRILSIENLTTGKKQNVSNASLTVKAFFYKP